MFKLEIKSKKLNTLLQFIYYALIGGSTFLIDIMVMNILWKVTGKSIGNINYIFKLISFIIYSSIGYQLNKKITFKSDNSNKSSYFKYASVVGILSLVDAIVVSNLTQLNIWSINNTLWANICNFGSSATTGIIGFLINKLVIFKKE